MCNDVKLYKFNSSSHIPDGNWPVGRGDLILTNMISIQLNTWGMGWLSHHDVPARCKL